MQPPPALSSVSEAASATSQLVGAGELTLVEPHPQLSRPVQVVEGLSKFRVFLSQPLVLAFQHIQLRLAPPTMHDLRLNDAS